MARPKMSETMNIAQLERVLESRRRLYAELMKDRHRLVQQLGRLDRRIAAIAGGRSRNGLAAGGGGRPRNSQSLVAMMEASLRKSGKPMGVGDIMEAVQRDGYQSSSANFRSIVNQMLIKDKRFASAGRGMYQLKK